MSCPHVLSTNLNLPTASSKVFKDECVLCFDTPELTQGIDICLSCFQGGCLNNERNHSKLHFQKTGHSLVMNLRKVKKMATEKSNKITKLEIKEEKEEDLFDVFSTVKCLACDGKELDLSESNLKQVVNGVLEAASAKKQSEIKAWEQELISCKHSSNLVQPESCSSVFVSKCSDCDLSQNLWLCLTCGNLGCGRQQFGGLGGNGHALKHFESSGHPLCVKLGTITPDGTADIFCYACGEERLDPHLSSHLFKFGINVESQKKTEKSLTEMQLEQNLKFDFSMTTDDGKQLEPAYGPGLTGMKNLGNSCYMASSLQCIFGLEPFEHRFTKELANHREYCPERPYNCLLCQSIKLADGLLSGRYSVPQNISLSNEELNSVSQKGIVPSMLKTVIGKDHEEFSTMRQQDANEFIDHYLKMLFQQDVDRKKSPVNALQFITEQRLQCLQCERVKYSTVDENTLPLFVPAQKKPADKWSHLDKPTDDDVYEPVSFQNCIDKFFEASYNEGYKCSQCNEKTTVSSTMRIKRYPSVLMIVMKRFIVDERYMMKKLNLKIKAPPHLDLLQYLAKGQQQDEILLPESAPEQNSPNVDQEALNQLLQMGFPEVHCIKALIKTGNQGADMAMNWLFEHMDDPDIDAPLIQESKVKEFSEGELSMLTDMGFTIVQAKKALQETQGNMERAVDWLFSHADQVMEDEPTQPNDHYKDIQNENPPNTASYELVSFISHRGPSASCGHYVAHVKRNGNWYLFNDEKVVHVPKIDDATGEGYIYFYTRK